MQLCAVLVGIRIANVVNRAAEEALAMSLLFPEPSVRLQRYEGIIVAQHKLQKPSPSRASKPHGRPRSCRLSPHTGIHVRLMIDCLFSYAVPVRIRVLLDLLAKAVLNGHKTKENSEIRKDKNRRLTSDSVSREKEGTPSRGTGLGVKNTKTRFYWSGEY